MESPDVVLEMAKEKGGDTVVFSYKVNSRSKDEGKSAIEFLQIMSTIFGSMEDAEEIKDGGE